MQERQREQASSSATAKRPKMEVKEEAEAPVLHTSGQVTTSTPPSLPATFSRPPPNAISPAAAPKTEEDGWYKAALAKAQAIAKNMAQPPPAKIGTAENGPAPWIISISVCLSISQNLWR